MTAQIVTTTQVDMAGSQIVDLSTDQLMEAIHDYVNKHCLVKPMTYRGVVVESDVDPVTTLKLLKHVRIVYLPKQ